MSRRERGMRKSTVYECKHLSMKDFKKRGLLKEGNFHLGSLTFMSNGNPTGSLGYGLDLREPARRYIKLSFTQTDRLGNKKEFKYDIRITVTDCNYGGLRYWFVCPHCRRRFVNLYLDTDGYFYCRKCLNLCYPSQLEGAFSRMFKLMGPTIGEEEEAHELLKTIKYPYRNGKPTRKYKRYQKLMGENLSFSQKLAGYQIFENWMQKRNDKVSKQ